MSSVHVDITWSGGKPSASPDPVKVKLSNGEDKVKWESGQTFVINIQGSQIPATQHGSKYVADSHQFTSAQTIHYTIAASASGHGEDPQIDVEG